TLVLAYAGASLPLLLLFAQGDQSVGRLLTSEVIAVEVVRMLVGSIGLVASVPITTALAAWALGPGEPVGARLALGPDGSFADLPEDDDDEEPVRPRHAAPRGWRARRRRRAAFRPDVLAPQGDPG